MRKIKTISLAILLSIFSFSCDDLFEEISASLSEGEVVDGLKKALTYGTDSSVVSLSTADGYLKDQAVKILLPPEAQAVKEKVDQIPTLLLPEEAKELVTLLDQMEEKMNRSAEAAAVKAAPIFKTAITDLSIEQGWDILNGKNPLASAKGNNETKYDSAAATHYLQAVTTTKLQDEFKAPIDDALKQPLVGGVSAHTAWAEVIDKYNILAPLVEGLEPMNSDLTDYVTGKALEGLFYKVAQEEMLIRDNPFAWADDLIKKVFGSIK